MQIPKVKIRIDNLGNYTTYHDNDDLEDIGEVEEITDIDDPLWSKILKKHNPPKILHKIIDPNSFLPLYVVEFEGRKYCYSWSLAQSWRNQYI